MMIRLAWRNLWRNKRRSLIVLASIIVGVMLMDFSGNFMRGMVRQMVDIQLGAHLAHVEIHARGFNDNKVVQNYMTFPDSQMNVVRANSNVRSASRRTFSFGLLSSATSSAGVSLVGVDPVVEPNVTVIRQQVKVGRYLSGAPNEIVIGKKLAQTLDVGIGDRVVAMASATDGTVGSEMFRVVGLYESASLSFDKLYVYIPLSASQAMLRAGEKIAEVAIVTKNPATAIALRDSLRAVLGPRFEVLSYHDLLPSLLAQVQTMESLMIIFYLLIGAAMMFGIVNTMLMSVFERIRELGVLLSIGMKHRMIVLMIESEAALLGIVGTLAGLGASIGANAILSRTGLDLSAFSSGLATFGIASVIYPIMNSGALVQEGLIVVGVCLVAAVYPAMRAVRLEPVRAIYHV